MDAGRKPCDGYPLSKPKAFEERMEETSMETEFTFITLQISSYSTHRADERYNAGQRIGSAILADI